LPSTEPTPTAEHTGVPPPDALQDTAATFGLLSATVRLQLIWLLAEHERDVGTLAEQTGQSVATVSHHLAKLKLAGIIRARRDGKRQVHYVCAPYIVDLVRLGVANHHNADASGQGHRRSGSRGA
jgi:DNA-binding transcriptional ArsR family regulator